MSDHHGGEDRTAFHSVVDTLLLRPWVPREYIDVFVFGWGAGILWTVGVMWGKEEPAVMFMAFGAIVCTLALMPTVVSRIW